MKNIYTIREELIASLNSLAQKNNSESPQPLSHEELCTLLISSFLEEEGQ